MSAAIKQRAHALIEALLDDATWQALMYALELRDDIDAGLAELPDFIAQDSKPLALSLVERNVDRA